MKYKWKKLVALSLIVCMFGMAMTGCGSVPDAGAEAKPDTPEPISDETNAPAETDTPKSNTDEAEKNNVNDSDDAAADTETPTKDDSDDSSDTENSSEASGKWHVYDSDLAAVTDADFEGDVHKIDADSFFIFPMETTLTEDGALITVCSPDVEVPEEELVQVVFDNDTIFTLRDIYDGGERHEDSEASFQNIEKGLSVALKGEFQNDVFRADTIRINKVH